jgi:AhpD family alkylhydroperoxidase
MEHEMQARLSLTKAAPEAYQAMLAFSNFGKTSGIDPALAELVKIRASQINGCAFCLHMHTRDARAKGETEDRIYLLDAWHESPLYSERERAALAWADAMTRLGPDGVPDAVFETVRQHFSETEICNLSMIIVGINSWNRLMIAFRVPPAVKPIAMTT